MELTILLAKVFGLYLIVAGVEVFLNRKHLMLGVVAMFKERFAQLLAGMMALLGGLLLVNIHTDWSTLPAGVVSAIGWLILVKGLLYLFVPEVHLAKFVKNFSERSWYTIDGTFALVIGLYLVNFGFGWF